MAEETMKSFLEMTPPGRVVEVVDLAIEEIRPGGASYELNLPTLTLFCAEETCNGMMQFQPSKQVYLDRRSVNEKFIDYVCRNCKESHKRFALLAKVGADKKSGEVYKYGEQPQFGPHTPSRLVSLVGPEKEYFLKGRRAESQGLGIAAFAYYRRVIENQKNRFIDEIIRVASRVGAAPEVLADLERAKEETQFSTAVSKIKHGIPQVLLISGQNPLALLHSALSEGLHAQTDEQCLELATSVRVVMAELAERISIALKEQAELQSAVSRLLAKK